MRKLLLVAVTLLSAHVFAATAVDDAYACNDKSVIKRIAADQNLAGLGAKALFDHVAAISADIDRNVEGLDQAAAATQETLQDDRAALASEKALDFQTGIRKNLRFAEAAVRGNEEV